MIMNVYFYFPRGLFLAFKYNVGIKQVSLHSLHKSTYLFCGAEWLPGRWTGRRRRTEPTAASCWLSSHTDRLTQMNITTVGENAPTGVFWHLTCTAFIHCFHFSVLSSLLTSTLFSLSLSLSPFLFFFISVCVCSPLRPGCLGSHLEIIRILGSACPLGWTCVSATGWQLHWPTGSVTERLSNWLDNCDWLTGRVADPLADWLTEP